MDYDAREQRRIKQKHLRGIAAVSFEPTKAVFYNQGAAVPDSLGLFADETDSALGLALRLGLEARGLSDGLDGRVNDVGLSFASGFGDDYRATALAAYLFHEPLSTLAATRLRAAVAGELASKIGEGNPYFHVLRAASGLLLDHDERDALVRIHLSAYEARRLSEAPFYGLLALVAHDAQAPDPAGNHGALKRLAPIYRTWSQQERLDYVRRVEQVAHGGWHPTRPGPVVG